MKNYLKTAILLSMVECLEIIFMNDSRLEEAIIKTKAQLIILDPIQAYIGANVDMHRANEVRPIF